ncbi:MAG: Peptidoglycan glycosyltransferase [Solirubrobacterales bacterium]|jgi:cell division protein FtsI/penicillin-binding protein 2|nr:Peptidoglycan glycosyltransferase [Solirubrobacterales bacterium]
MQLIDRRLGLIFCGFLLLFSVALARAAWLQGVRGGELRADARTQQVTTIPVPGERGRVLDRTGTVLAVSEDAATVIATPYQVKNPKQTAQRLAEVLPVSRGEIEDALSDRDSGFAYVAKKVSVDEADAVDELQIHGISTLPDSRRIYPQGELAAQVIGSVNDENEGLTGLEQALDDTVGGENGEQEVVHDARGEPIRFDTLTEATTGEDLRLTIDAAIQARAEEAIAAAGEAYSAAGASAVVMDPDTGDVLAMANWPGFDPYDPGDASDEQLLNRTTGFTYEPGSTFKAFTVAAAMEEGLVSPETSFYLPPTIKVADRVIEEAHARPTIHATVAEILAQSSNVGAVKIGTEVGAERFDEWVRRFGFGEPTGVGFPGEEQGILLDVDDYSGSTMGNMPLGQGLSVTPMQMATAYAAIANGGILRNPRLISQAAGEARPRDTEGTRVLSPATASQLRSMLEGVVAAGGTAPEVEVPGYELAGKTGTAEKAVDGGYSETDYVASFVGFAPARDPELLVAVIVDEPMYEHSGGVVAAPVFGDIAEFALPYLGISPG